MTTPEKSPAAKINRNAANRSTSKLTYLTCSATLFIALLLALPSCEWFKEEGKPEIPGDTAEFETLFEARDFLSEAILLYESDPKVLISESSNTSGEYFLPGGRTDPMGTLGQTGEFGHWWTATETSDKAAYMCGLSYREDGIGRNGNYKVFGFSVRCVKDE